MAENGNGNGNRNDPVYHIVRGGADVDMENLKPGDVLTVVAVDQMGKTPEKATDAAVDELPVSARTGKFGAFTARSWWSDEYEVEQVVQLKKKGRQGRLNVTPAAKKPAAKRKAAAKPSAA